MKKFSKILRRLSSLSGQCPDALQARNRGNHFRQDCIRLDEQIRKCILMLENKWSAKNIEFDMELPRQTYDGSASLLEQVWINLIEQRNQTFTEGSSIHIAICEISGMITVSISDDGDGMTEEVEKHIFEKFYQGDKSHKAEGNGLGLALVKRIIDLCKGDITVESAPGKGSMFIISCPNIHIPLKKSI